MYSTKKSHANYSLHFHPLIFFFFLQFTVKRSKCSRYRVFSRLKLCKEN